jgi:hypothetical protein
VDPDLAFKVNQDPDSDQDPYLIRIQGFDDKKLKKKNTDLIKNCKPSALKREHPALQKMNFCPPGSAYGFRDPIESRSNPDPDPQHCGQDVRYAVYQSINK